MSAEIKPPDKIMTQVAEAANHGRFIWLARFGWLIIFVLMMSLFAVNLPHVYLDTANEWQVGQALFAALQIFPSIKEFAIAVIGLRLVALTVFVGTALFLAWRKWDDWFVLFVSAALLMMAYMFGMNFDVDLIRYPRWLEQIFPAIRSVVPVLLIMNMLLLFYLFPDGRFVPRWLGLLLLPALVVLADVFGVTFEAPWDDFIGRILGNNVDWWTLFTSLLLVTALVGLISQFVRFKFASSQEQRQQTKWVLLGLASILVTPLFLWVILDQLDLGTQSTRHFISIIIETIIPILLPVTIAVSIMRFKLWEVDLFINRAVVYGALTAVILAVYGLGVGLAGVLLPTATSWFVPALALALVILVVSPLRGRIQSWANRILPVQHLEEPENRVLAPAVVSWRMRLAQAVWLVVLAFVSWQIVSHLISFDRLTQRMMREWIVQESTRGLASRTTENFVRLIVVSEIWILVISVTTAVVIFWRKRDEWMALYAAYMLLIASFAVSFGSYPTPLEELFTFLGIGLLLFFPFIFPDGRLVPRSWRWRGLLMATLFLTPLLAFAFARLARPDVNADEHAYLSFIFTLTAVLVAGVISQIYRYRRLSDTVQRRQTRWVVLGFSARVAWFVWIVLWLSTIPSILSVPDSLSALVTVLGLLITATFLPLSIAIAILHDRLWQIDVVLNRTLVFGGLTALVFVLYVVVVGILGTLFQSGNNLLLSVLATGLIAILFNPLRQRLQQNVNRFMYGQRDDPMAVMAEMGKQLENTAVPGETLPALVQTIAQTLKLPYVAIVTNDDEIIASVGAVREPPLHTYPLVYQSRTIGHLAVSQRTAKEQFTADEERLLRSVARQAGTAVYAYQLTDQLQHSRERLVTTREEERRRLRRDLHDGLGPQLATLSVKVSAAQNLLKTDLETAESLLAEVKAESQNAISEIRRVVDGLRPSALDQLGLVSALQEFVVQNGNGRVRITFQAPDALPALPAAVEVAAYRIVTEAVTNSVRHANAQTCTIHLSVNHDMILEVQDDGRGLPIDFHYGVGLISMQARAEELGGTFSVKSEPGHGTQVISCIPITDKR